MDDTSLKSAPPAATFTHREIMVIMAGLMLGMFLAALDQTILGAALPRIGSDLGGAQEISWVISAYLLSSTAVTPIYGKLSDLYGRRLMLQSAILIFITASMLCGLAGSISQLIAFRALQGVGGGGLLVLAQATLADVVSPRNRGKYQGYFAAMWLTASMIGPTLGGFFADHLTWRWSFWLNIPLGLASLFVVQASLKALVVKRIRHKIDYLGGTLIVGAVTCLLLVTTLGGAGRSWTSPLILGLIGGAIVLLGLAIFQERRAAEPILPPRLFRNRAFVVSNATCIFYSMAIIGSIVFMPSFLQMVYQMDASRSGLVMIPFLIATPLTVIIGGRIVAHTGRYKMLPILGLCIMMGGMATMHFVSSATPLVLSMTAMTIFGLGVGFLGPILIVSMQNSIDWRDMGAGTAAFNFFRNMGGSFGVTLFGTVLLARLESLVGGLPVPPLPGDAEPGITLLHLGGKAVSSVPEAAREGVTRAIEGAFNDMFLAGFIVAAIGLVIVLFMKEVPLKTVTAAAERAEAQQNSQD